MKKGLKIFICILLIIFIALGTFVYTQWNTITAFMDALKYSEEDIDKNVADGREELQNFLSSEKDITVRELTEEEAKALTEGELTEEEVIEIITGKEPPAQSDNPQQPQNPSPKPTEHIKTSEEIISELIAKLYIQKSTYLNKLDDIEAQARTEFVGAVEKGTPKDEQKAQKQAMLPKYLSVVAAWERECDNAVYSVIDEIRAELKKAGKDESVADNLKSAYLSEKRAKKSYFINRYMD